jgi:hypothetical protein
VKRVRKRIAAEVAIAVPARLIGWRVRAAKNSFIGALRRRSPDG